MKNISIGSLKAGMRIATPVYNSDGVALVQEGSMLDQKIIKKLMFYGVSSVYIHDEELSGETILDIVDRQTRVDAIKTLKEWVFNVRSDNIARLSEDFSLNRIIEKILEDLRRNKDKCVQFLDIRTIDSYTYAHSVNVCILAMITGISLGYTDQELEVLGMAALLHDIGKTKLPASIVNYEGEFNQHQMEMMRQHPEIGYKMMLEEENINPVIAEIIYQHHERYDGTGYPRQLRHGQILESAYIIAVADVFDALTGDRTYRKKYLPHEAIEYLYGAGNRYFSYRVVEAFVRHVALYPVGTPVKLNTGEEAVVVEVDPRISSRPKVRITRKRDGKRPMSPKILDLKKSPTVIITEVIK